MPARRISCVSTIAFVLAITRAASGQISEGPPPSMFAGQIPTPAGPPPTPRHTGVRALLKDLVGDVAHLPSRENAIWLGVGGGLALATHPSDPRLNRAFRGNDAVDVTFAPGRVLGESYTLFGAALTTYIVGRTRDQPKVSHVGMDLIEAVAISESLVQITKHATRRERPDGSGRTSFPSGHAADTFAFATALERHLGWRGAVPAYMLASYVALSRLPANRHWFSDVMFGSAVGIIAGRTVTRHGSKYPFAIVPMPRGVMVTFLRHSP